MKFLGRMLLWQKLALLGAVAALMVAVPAALYVQTALSSIAAAEREEQGLKSTRLALDLARVAAQHRGLTNAVLGGNETARAPRDTRRGDYDRAATTLEAEITQVVQDPEIYRRWQKLKADWSAIKTRLDSQSISASDSFAAHTALISGLLSLIENLTDHFGLSLDAKPESSFLIQAALIKLPLLAEQLGQARGFGAGVLARAAASQTPPNASDRATLNAILGRGSDYAAEFANEIGKSMRYDEEVRQRMESQVQDLIAGTTAFLQFAGDEIVKAEHPSVGSSEYFDRGTAIIDHAFAVNEQAGDAVTLILRKQIGALRVQLAQLAAGIASVALLGAFLGMIIARGITRPAQHLVATMIRIAQGDRHARARLETTDEVGLLARQFDAMVDEREAVTERLHRENEQLNNSIIALLQSVAELGKRDLTVRAPVAEDITGPVADAINAFASETAKVLNGVTSISNDVARASSQVKMRSDSVITVATKERQQIEETAKRLNSAAVDMRKIAELAKHSETSADNAIRTTQSALKSVTDTVSGINATRDTIRETEKRIKRLGERSQEIGGVVSLINGIADRTHILALNASMHAASAGEAGRGFAVVAHEVQRLAENARDATTQIATLVASIQSETQETVTTMNSAIAQVVDGSKLAEEAGRQMQATRDTTTELVGAVQQIASSAATQAKMTSDLQEFAKLIRESTAKTSVELQEQTAQTNDLVKFAQRLVDAVTVFKLPATARAA